MSRLSYPLKKYIKVVESIAERNGLERVGVFPNKGTKVRFELFEKGAEVPTVMWVIHHSHNRKKEIGSKEDYKKAARCLCCEYEEFIKEFEKV